MDREDRLRLGLADLADGAGWTDLQDRVVRASNRLAWRRRALTSAAAVAVVAAVAVPVVLSGQDRSAPVAGPPPPSLSASPSPSASQSASPSASPSAPVSSTSGPPGETGCPVSAKTLFTALQRSYVGGVDIGQPTGVSNIVCYRRYATAKPVPAVGGTHILFGYQLPERKWIGLNAGSKGMCDSFVLDGSISARLPGC